MLNFTHSTLTTAPSIAGMFETITDLFLYTESAENAGRENDGREIDGPMCWA